MSILSDRELCRNLEVDLLEKGVDLLDLYRGKLSIRRVIAIATVLNKDSHLGKILVVREVGPDGEWDANEYFLAAIVNSSRNLEYLTALRMYFEGGEKGSKPIPPEPVRSPGYQPPKPIFASTREVMGFFNVANQINNKGGR